MRTENISQRPKQTTGIFRIVHEFSELEPNVPEFRQHVSRQQKLELTRTLVDDASLFDGREYYLKAKPIHHEPEREYGYTLQRERNGWEVAIALKNWKDAKVGEYVEKLDLEVDTRQTFVRIPRRPISWSFAVDEIDAAAPVPTPDYWEFQREGNLWKRIR